MKFLGFLGVVLIIFQAWNDGSVNGISLLGFLLVASAAGTVIYKELTNTGKD